MDRVVQKYFSCNVVADFGKKNIKVAFNSVRRSICNRSLFIIVRCKIKYQTEEPTKGHVHDSSA